MERRLPLVHYSRTNLRYKFIFCGTNLIDILQSSSLNNPTIKHTASEQRRIDVETTSCSCIDVDRPVLYQYIFRNMSFHPTGCYNIMHYFS